MEMASKGVLELEKTPPTSRAAYYHALRAHHQVTIWKLLNNNEMHSKAEDWGWKLDDNNYCPIMTDNEVAPECVLQVIRCKCKSSKNQCGTKRCSCRKHGLSCVTTCSDCHGEDCENKEVYT